MDYNYYTYPLDNGELKLTYKSQVVLYEYDTLLEFGTLCESNACSSNLSDYIKILCVEYFSLSLNFNSAAQLTQDSYTTEFCVIFY